MSKLDADRQHFIGSEGLTITGTPREVAFCDAAARAGPYRPLVVRDTLLDPLFANNPLVTGTPHLRFYAGVALALDNFAATVCVADVQLRPEFGAEQTQQLRDIATFVEAPSYAGDWVTTVS